MKTLNLASGVLRVNMLILVVLLLLTTIWLCVLSVRSAANLDETKAAACDRWKDQGFKCVGYAGYQWGMWIGGSYGGAMVWHTLKRDESPGVVYSGSVQRWGDEYHVYGPRAIDAPSSQR